MNSPRAPGSYAGLTAKQAELLSFLRFEAAKGITPSFEEMADHLGLVAKSGPHRLLTGLQERGFVERLPNRARAIRVFDEPQAVASTPSKRPLREHSTSALVQELKNRGMRFTGFWA